LSLRKGFLGYL